jgi:hypothetical protein
MEITVLKVIYLASFLSIFLSGCTSFLSKIDQAKEVLNPKQIHDETAFNKGGDPYLASQIPVTDYYAALNLTKPKFQPSPDGKSTIIIKSDAAAVSTYVDAGIGLVDAYCLRWFQTIGELNRLANYQQ